MTLPDLPASRKPPSRRWLYGPYIALAVAVAVWSGAWLWIRGQVAQRLQAAERPAGSESAGSGPTLSWSHAHIGGYPFRVEVVLDDVRAAEPSGWAVSAPQVRAEAYAYDLGHWIGYAPQGVVLSRPGAGEVAIAGDALRASVAADGTGARRVAVEGIRLNFQPRPGARPFPLAFADHIDLHTRPAGPAGQVEFLFQLQGGRLPPGTPLGRLAAGQPVSSAWRGVVTQAPALAGRDWPQMARAWAAAGGTIELTSGWISAGGADLDAVGGRLAVGPDGRLSGAVALGLAHAPAMLAAVARTGALAPGLARIAAAVAGGQTAAQGAAARADLTFRAGVSTFGPLALGPAPRIY